MKSNQQTDNEKEFVRLRFIIQDCDIGEVARIISKDLDGGIFSVFGVKNNKKYHSNNEEEVIFNDAKALRYVQVKRPLLGLEDIMSISSLHRDLELFIVKDLSCGPEIVRITASH